jgi:hypothetical protein
MPSPKPKQIDMDFYKALRACAEGKKIRRPEWPDKVHGAFVNAELHIFLEADNLYHPWTVSAADVAATDWRLQHSSAIQ